MHLYEENKTRTSCINGQRDVLACVNGTTCIIFFIILYEYIKFVFYSKCALCD